jgi:hypothetical protein
LGRCCNGDGMGFSLVCSYLFDSCCGILMQVWQRNLRLTPLVLIAPD